MFLPPREAVLDCITLEVPMNVTAASLYTIIAPPFYDGRQKETREKVERNSKEEE